MMSLFEACKFFANDVYGLTGNLSSLGRNEEQDLWVPFPIQGHQYFVDNATGFGGAVYHNVAENILVSAFRGTEFSTLQDLLNDIDLSDSYSPPQYETSRAFMATVNEEVEEQGLSGTTVILTGHSLGGGLAQLLGCETGFKTLTFNAVGMEQLTNNLDVLGFTSYSANMPYHHITNYAISSDIVANTFTSIGPQVFAHGANKPIDPLHWCGYYYDAHMRILKMHQENEFILTEQTPEGKFFKDLHLNHPCLFKSADTFAQLMCIISQQIHTSFGDFPLDRLAEFFIHKNPEDYSIHSGDLRVSHREQCVLHDPTANLSVIRKV